MPTQKTAKTGATLKVPPDKIPRHVAIIMDGNGRWAGQRGLPRVEGHRHGAESVRAVVREASRLGVEVLTLYAFSVENWSRPKTEVTILMRLLGQFLKQELKELDANGVRLQAIGRLQDLPDDVRHRLEAAIAKTAQNTGLNLVIALSYGGRVELLEAAKSLMESAKRGELAPADLDEKTLSDRLYTAGLPDPDLVIRTSGEMRLSNFLLWQTSYAEFYTTPVLWPDFREKDFRQALTEYARRQRRYGGV
jgi:undecaprenyl diphosphate synthase